MNAAQPSARGRSWWLYHGPDRRTDPDVSWPPPPPWRVFPGEPTVPAPRMAGRRPARSSAAPLRLTADQLDVVNAALLLRQPLLVTGRARIGRSGLAYDIAHELGLGPVLRWNITGRSTLRSGLYDYDAMGRAQAITERQPDTASNLGDFVCLGPLGTALLPHDTPRVLLIDTFDACDMDLPDELADIFDTGSYTIPELVRARPDQREWEVHTADLGDRVVVRDGIVTCRAFPVVVVTCNDERHLPPQFLRQCLALRLPDPDLVQLHDLVRAHFADSALDHHIGQMIEEFDQRRHETPEVGEDHLLNAVYLALRGARDSDRQGWTELLNTVWPRQGPADR